MESKKEKQAYAFVAWQRPGQAFRLTRLAGAFGCTTHNFYRDRFCGFKPPVPFRYLLQAVDTIKLLCRTHPRVVVVQTPPFVLCLVAWVYCKCSGSMYVTDNHSGVFTADRWLRFNRIDRFLFRNAAANIAHNSKNLETLVQWNAHHPVMIASPAVTKEEILDESVELPPELQQNARGNARRILYVNRFTPWHCHEEVMQAALLMPDALFFVTGDPAVAGFDVSKAPENVVLTGLLPRNVFVRLMNTCDAVLSLTKLEDAVAWTYRDCIALKKPFVGTDNVVAKELFGEFGLFTTPDPQQIARQLQEVIRRKDEFIPKMDQYIVQDKQRFQRDIDNLKSIVNPQAQS